MHKNVIETKIVHLKILCWISYMTRNAEELNSINRLLFSLLGYNVIS